MSRTTPGCIGDGNTTRSTRRPRLAPRVLAGAVGAVLGLTFGVGAAAADAAPRDLPDLIVTDVSPVIGSYLDGSRVTFQATIMNVGAAEKTYGAIDGVSFAVDGRVVSWSDDTVSSIAPGQSITVTANGGPSGVDTWTAVPGRHTVRAWVDDVSRIPESAEGNNILRRAIRVRRAGVAPVTGVSATTQTSPEQYRVNHDTGVTLRWTVPAGQPVGTTYTVVEHPVDVSGSQCDAGRDVTRVTVTPTAVTSLSVVLTQKTGLTCWGHGSQNESTFSVVSTAPRGAPADSARSGACVQTRGYESSAPLGPNQYWLLACADGGSLADSVKLLGAVSSVDAGSSTDAGFTGGQVYVAAPDEGSSLDAVQLSTRWGWSRYELPVPAAGRYKVALSFVEPTWTQPGQRVFGLSAEGATVRDRFDILDEFPQGSGSVEAFVDVQDGNLTIDASTIVDHPIVSAIYVSRVGAAS